MRSLLTALALLLAAAGLSAQTSPPNTPPPNKAAQPQPTGPVKGIQPVTPAAKAAPQPEQPPADSQPGPPDDTIGPMVVGVLCTIAILFAVCYPMRRED